MSNALKKRAPSNKIVVNPYIQSTDPMRQQIYFQAMQNVREKIIPEIEAKTWVEAEKWSNFINSLTLLTAAEELFDLKEDDLGRLIERTNWLTRSINAKHIDIYQMINHMEKDNHMMFPSEYKELIKRYGPQ